MLEVKKKIGALRAPMNGCDSRTAGHFGHLQTRGGTTADPRLQAVKYPPDRGCVGDAGARGRGRLRAWVGASRTRGSASAEGLGC